MNIEEEQKIHHSLEKLKFSLKDYDFLQKWSFGRTGNFYIVRQKKRTQLYFLKIYIKWKIIEKKEMDKLLNEILLYQSLESGAPYFQKLKGVCSSDYKYIGLLFDIIPGGTFRRFLNRNGKVSIEQSKFYAANLMKILQFLHNKNLIYRDLRPETLLIDKNGILSLLDFTLSKNIKNINYATSLCGTPNYLAPEIILSKKYNKSVDWWAFGVILFEITIGYDPFNDSDPMFIYQNIISNKIKFPTIIDKDFKNLINKLLNPDPSKRYGCLKNGITDIVDHRFFNDFNWRKFDKFELPPPFVPILSGEDDINYLLTKEERAANDENKQKLLAELEIIKANNEKKK